MAVIFSQLTRSMGRNGIFKTSGLAMTQCVNEQNEKLLVIEPLTSKNRVANCNIEIPLKDVPALIEELQKHL